MTGTFFSGFGNGFAIQSTEPMSCGELVFCERGQKLSLQIADIFSGRAWAKYNVSLTKDCAEKWTDPTYECFDWTTNKWKNSVKPNGYFVQIANCKVY